MKIRMTKTVQGSEDGIALKIFEAGKAYDVKDDLAEAFVDHMGVAVTYEIKEIEIPEKDMKFEKPEKSRKKITLKDKPKKWIGLQVRKIDGATELKIVDVIRGGTVVMSDDRHLSYGTIRKHWELTNGD